VSLWRQLSRGVHTLLHREDTDREIDEEVRHFLEQAAAAHRDRGLPPGEALRAARHELGHELGVREAVRSYGWENAVETLFADLRYAARRLRRAPGFTLITVLTLAIGLGATTAIFSVVYPLLLAPLPYPGADRVATIWEVGSDGAPLDSTFGMEQALAERSRSFEVIALLKPWQPALAGVGEPERLEGERVSASYFRVLGVAPTLGRGFDSTEDRAGGPAVVVLSHALWQRRFGGDPGIVGHAVNLDGVPATVVGIMPEGFEDVLAPHAALWAPLQYGLSQGRAWGHHLRTVGRLRAGVTLEQARRELDVLGQEVLDEQHPETYASEVAFQVDLLHREVTRAIRPALVAVLGAVALVLAIACVNVTNLLLARGVHRRGELALRSTLGAGHRRLVWQLLTENLLLAAVGGAAGLGLAALGVRALGALIPALIPTGLPRTGSIVLDGTVFAFGLVLTTLAGLGFGVVPALQAARPDLHRELQDDGRGAISGRRRLRGALVVAEVALALVLLVGSGLLLRSLERLFAVDPGFRPAGVLTLQVRTSGPRFADPATTRRFFHQVLETVRRLPGVTDAALTSQLPLSGDSDLYGVHFDPPLPDDPGEVRGSFRYAVSPGYLEALGVPLVRGRLLNERDREGAPRAALISESLARRRLPGVDPIGRRLEIGVGPLYTVVGVVGDVKQESLTLMDADAVYTTEAQWRYADDTMSLVVRAKGDVTALVPALRQAIWSVDPDQPVARVVTMEELVAASAARRRFVLFLFEAFALTALVLAAAGIYGVLSGSVAERTREIGVRVALGASRRDVLGLVVRQGMTLASLGVALGMVGAVAASRELVALLFGVSPLDPATYAGVVALLAAVAAAACAVPAWRASRVDPASTLREG